jgi:WhiB family transcriptional regulator, redox-sensing transcriptional regulator
MTQTQETRLPDTSWMLAGACLSEDPDIFWIDPEEPKEVREQKIAAAARVCANCPVWRECRDWGLYEVPEDRWSILGGLTARQRMAERRRRAGLPGFIPAGESNGQAKLTGQLVTEIRARRGEDRRALADEYGISRSTIGKVQRGDSWGRLS